MKTLLQVHSSLNGADSLSSGLAQAYAREWQRADEDRQVIERDLAAQPIPHLSAEAFKAFSTAPAERDRNEQAAVDLSDTLIDELRQADVIVLALPMYNFGIPSTVKAWFDYVARAGVTFRYTSAGPEGLLKDKRAIVFATRGGVYAGTDMDTQTPYVRHFLAFLGISDVEFVYVEGTAMGEKKLKESIDVAHERIDQLRMAA